MPETTIAAAVAALALALATTAPAFAQAFPSKPVRIIVPVSAGGLHDILMRGFAQELGRIWGQPVIVENRTGANHIIATDYVVKSPPDGHTLLITDKAMIANPILYSKLPYDADKDLAPVANVVLIPNVLIAAADFPANTLLDFVAAARTRPGQINYGTFGVGSFAHVEIEAISARLGMRLTHVPYKGISEVIPALLAGQVAFALAGVPPVLQLIRQGKIKVYTYSGSRRSPLLPDVPTYAEAGLAGYDSRSWTGFLVPAATPKPAIAKIAEDLNRALTTPEFLEKFIVGVGLEPYFLSPEQFADLLNSDRKTYGDRVRNINVRLN